MAWLLVSSMTGGRSRWVLLLGLSLLALALASPARAAEAAISENANRRFKEGVRYLTSQDPDRYEKAYREFKAAYADSPSWRILGNLGIVAHQLERDGEAADAYRGYLEGAGKELSADEREQFSEDLKLVESGHFSVKLETVPEGAWIIDERLPESGRPVVNRYGPTSGPLELRVRAGHHRIWAELGGQVSSTWELSEKAGATASRVLELPQAKAADEPAEASVPTVEDRPLPARGTSAVRVGSYVALGLGVAAAGVGTWFWLDARKTSDEADDAYAACDAADSNPGDGDCVSGSPLSATAVQLDRDDKRARTFSIVSYGAAGALLTTGIILFLVSGESTGDEDARASITPWVDARGIGLSGRF